MRRNPKLTRRINVRLSEEDFQVFEKGLQTSGLGRSEYYRRIALTKPIPDKSNLTAVRDMFKVNADLARLGNLLKLTLTQLDECLDTPPENLVHKVDSLVDQIRKHQADLKACINRVKVR